MAVMLGSVASFRKLKGRRLGMWDSCYTCLWPRRHTCASVWDHGAGMESISTSFLFAVIYWGFTAARTPSQRMLSIQFLRDLVDGALRARSCGFQLNLPRRGAEPVEVDGFGHFDPRTVFGPVGSIESVLVMDASGCRPAGDIDVPWVPWHVAHDRPHIVSFVVAALGRGNHGSDRWHGIALTFLRQLGDLVNQAAPRMMQTLSLPLCRPLATTAMGSRLVEQPGCDEALSDLAELPSLRHLAAELARIR